MVNPGVTTATVMSLLDRHRDLHMILSGNTYGLIYSQYSRNCQRVASLVISMRVGLSHR